MSRSNDVEALVARADWVERLAHALIRDPDAAADVAQDAWVAALTHQRTPSAPLARWMAAIVRNLARDRARRTRGRDAIELKFETPREGQAADKVVASLELHGRLVAAVRELDEPYRTAIALRYFEDLSPREIAARTGAPVRTVHTHLQRGLQRLRERLDREHRDRREWLSALLPFARRHDAWLGALAVKSKLKIAVAVCLVLASALVAWRIARRSGPTASALVVALPAIDRVEESANAVENDQRVELAAPPSESVLPQVQLALRGIVVDLEDRPLAGVGVVFAAEDGVVELTATTDGRGEFAMRDPERTGTLRPASDDFVAVLRPFVERGALEPLYVLAVAPHGPIAGVVIDFTGAPVADAQIEIGGSQEFLRTRIERVLDASESVHFKTISDEHGHFELRNAPTVASWMLSVMHTRWGGTAVVLPTGDRTQLRIAFQRPDTERSIVEGDVVDRDGRPLEGANVVFGNEETTTNRRGRFAFVVHEAPRAKSVLVACAGFEPFELRASDVGAELDADSLPNPLHVVLAPIGAAHQIRGLFVDEHGAPVADGAVQRIDGTQHGERWTAMDSATVESLIEGKLEQLGVPTNERGEFALAALPGSLYRLRAVDRRTLRMAETAPIPAGAGDVRIQLNGESSYARVAGRVVDGTDSPIAGAQVYVLRQAIGDERGLDDISYPESSRVETDADGRFEMHDVARAIWRLAVCGPRTNNLVMVDLAAERDVEQIEVRSQRACHLLVDARARVGKLRRLSCGDSKGNQIWITQREGRRSWGTASIGFVANRSPVVIVPDTVTELLLTDDGGGTTRVPVKLTPGELTVVRL